MEPTNTTAAEWQEPSAAQIAEWKKAHGIDTVFMLKAAEKDGSIKKAWLRPPGIADLARAAGSDRSKAGTYNQSLYENCVLSQHPDIKAKPSLYQGMIFNMDKIIVAAEVEVEALAAEHAHLRKCGYAQVIAQLQYHYHDVNIERLPQSKIIELFARLEWARQQEAKLNPLIQFLKGK